VCKAGVVPAPAPRIYIASPLGFTEAGRLYNDTVLLPAVRDAGFEALDPWDVDAEILRVFELDREDPERRLRLPDTNRAVGRRNADLIRSAAGMLAVLDGDDVDSGTAAEIGYGTALGCPVVGLRMDLRNSGDNEATLVNLQVEWFVLESGGQLTTGLGQAISALTAIVSARVIPS
jgi:nucleoside 2-deoxyribosyltransferase